MEGAWYKVPDSKWEPGLFGQSCVEYKGCMYIFGGCDRHGTFFNTLYCWNMKERTWTLLETSGTQPGSRNFHAAVLVKNQIYVHGGKSNGYHSDMYRYSIVKRKWHTVAYKDKAPLARYGHALLSWNGALYMVGGYDQHGFCCDDLYQFTPETHTWRKIQFISPLGAVTIGRFHSAACIYKSKILIYAGKGADSIRSDLLEYDLSNHTWKRVITAKSSSTNSDEPPGRWGHTANVIGDHLYVFGGRDAVMQFNELYCFDLINLRWKLLLPSQKLSSVIVPEPRYFHASVVVGQSLYFIWGKNIYDFNFDDIIEWRIQSAASLAEESMPQKDEIRTSVRSQGSDSSFSLTLGSTTTASNAGNRVSGEKRMRLKCVFREEMRIISVAPVIGYNELVDRLASEYGEEDLKIQYEDDEGDLITIRSATDVEEAFVFFGDAHRPSVKLLLSSNSNSNSTYSALSTTPTSHSIITKPNRTSRDFGPSSGLQGSGHIPSGSSGLANSSQSVGPTPLVPKRSSRLDFHVSSSSPTASPRTHSSSRNSASSSSGRHIVKWQSGGIIGEGGFGKVYLGMNADTGELMAVKQVPLGTEGNNQQIDALRREISLMQDLHHPNIVRYFGSEAKDGFLNIFLEYQPGGSIASLLTKFQHLSEKIIRSFTKQTLLGLDYLHSHGIAHRDIKGANLLVDLAGCVKLADFGTASKQLADLRNFSEGYKTVTGSPYWMAPEVIQGSAGGRSYGRKADIWSLGAAVVEMVTGKPPFHNLAPVTALFRIGSSSALPEIPNVLSAQGKDFLSQCFRRDVSARPNAAELLQHPWITELDESSSPTITNTYDTKTLAFERDSDESSTVVHAIGAPVPGPMPKNPKMSQGGLNGGGSVANYGEKKNSSTSLNADLASLQLQRTSSSSSNTYNTSTASEPASPSNAGGTSASAGSSKSRRKDKEKDKEKSPRSKSKSSKSSPRSDSEGVSKSPGSRSKRKSTQAAPPPQVDVEEDETVDDDDFGSILNFVSTRAHAE